MKLFQKINNNRICFSIIFILVIILLILYSKYRDSRDYIDDVISITAWNFASQNHALLDTLEYIGKVEDYDGAYDEDIQKEFYSLYENFQELCLAYRLEGFSGQMFTFDNKLADVYRDFNLDKMIYVHEQIESILKSHKVSYEDLLSYMDSSDINYNKLLIKEMKKIIAELNVLDFEP